MKASLRDFDPRRVAKLETKMWKAYYSHRFLRLGLVLIRLFKEQFRVNLLVAIQLGIHSGRAASKFRKTGDQESVKRLLGKYYRIIERHAKESFDPVVAANLELEWWLIHRHPNKSKKSLAQALSEAIAVLYEIEPTNVTKYAEYRAKAMNIRGQATYVTKTEPNWQEIESHLLTSYSALKGAVN